MPYKVRCKECKEFIYILKIMEQKTNYPCPSCNFDNVFDKKQSSIFFGVEEIKVEDIDNDIFKGVFEELTTENIEQHNKFLDDIKISNIDYFREEKPDNISDKKTNSE